MKTRGGGGKIRGGGGKDTQLQAASKKLQMTSILESPNLVRIVDRVGGGANYRGIFSRHKNKNIRVFSKTPRTVSQSPVFITQHNSWGDLTRPHYWSEIDVQR